MPETLRTRQHAMTRDLILDSLADLIVEDGVHDFSVQQVADRAGVSHRTVYRYFADREALLEALAARVDEEIQERGGPLTPGTAEGVAEAVVTNFGLFDELADDVVAGVILALGARIQPGTRRRRNQAFRKDLADAVDHLDEPRAEAAVALLRILGSSRVWFLLTRDLELTTPQAASAVSWAAEVLVRELRAGRGPGAPSTAGATAVASSELTEGV